MLFEKATINPPFNLPNAMPNEACFMYIRKGESLISSEEDSLLLRNGEGVLMKCGFFFGQLMSNVQGGSCEAIAIHFYPEVLKRVFDGSLPNFLKDHNYQFDENMVKLHADVLVDKYIEGLLFYFENPQLATEELLILKLKEIILLLLQTKNAPNLIKVLSNLFTTRTYDFKEIIEAHSFANLTVQQLAILTNLSVSTFKRKFKTIYSDTPASYFKRIKLAKAGELLMVSDKSISDIAFVCGFSDQALFSKSFKEHYKVSPSQFKKNQNNKKLNLLP